MDQQNQEQQKKKNNHHYNHRRRGNGGHGGEAGNAQATAPVTENRPAPRTDAKSGNGNRNGEIHTRRGNFRPAPDGKPDGGNEANAPAREPRENKENRPNGENREPRESRENGNHNNYRGRNGRGRGDNRPHDGHQNENRTKENAPKEPRQNDRRQPEAAKETPTNEGRGERNNDNRNRDRGDRGHKRRGDGRSNGEVPPRESVQTVKDPEMDSWFTPAPTEASASNLFSDKPAIAADPEPLPHIELDLNDILPPIVLEKYQDETQAEKNENAEQAEGETAPEEPVKTVEVIGVRFSKTGKVYYFEPNGNVARRGDAVIVETARGLEFGEAWQPNHSVPETDIVPPLRPVIRLADEKDVTHNADNRKREEEAFRICLDKIRAHGLDMKLVEAQYTFDNSKLLFYFTSAGRVDFRELVKDLASVFRTRIELRQIGIRDEAKLMGGLGICGRPLCCASFLSDFSQVSIKMAKEQNLSLNSAKISGTCGRLMCCLNYEYPVYVEASRRTPSVGTTVGTPDGVGTVVETNPLAGIIKVALSNAAPGAVPQYYKCADVRIMGDRKPAQSEASVEENSENADA